jgi:hypothetical protein
VAGESDPTLPVLEILPDGSYRSVLVNRKTGGKARGQLAGRTDYGAARTKCRNESAPTREPQGHAILAELQPR